MNIGQVAAACARSGETVIDGHARRGHQAAAVCAPLRASSGRTGALCVVVAGPPPGWPFATDAVARAAAAWLPGGAACGR